MTYRLQFEQWVPRPLDEVFLFFANPGNLPRIMPTWMQVELLEVHAVPPPGERAVTGTVSGEPPLAGTGSELTASYRVIPWLPFRAVSGARITAFEMNHYFEDIQTRGPFKSWHHRHEFRAETRNGIIGTVVRDYVEYDPGWGLLGRAVNRLFLGPQMRQTFQHRHRALEALLTGVRRPCTS